MELRYFFTCVLYRQSAVDMSLALHHSVRLMKELQSVQVNVSPQLRAVFFFFRADHVISSAIWNE